MERLSEYDWRTETNLSARAGLTPQQTHNAVEQGILGIGGLNIQLELMQRYAALTGFRLEDLPLVEEKFESVVRQIDPQAKEARFDRVLELTQLPQVDPDVTVQDVDLARLIEITSGAEAAEFRRWVRGVDAFTDGELKEAFHPVRDAIGNAVRSKAGKAMRIATTSGAGVLVPPVGIGLGVLDMFVTEKILPGPGPTAFLSRLYPSVFQTTSLT